MAAVESLALCIVDIEGAMRSPDPDGVDLDAPGLGVLLALRLFGPLRPSTLAQLLTMTSGTTSKRIERLERLSMVTRSLGAVPGDRRGVVVEIRPRGRREIERVERVSNEHGAQLLDALRLLVDEPLADPSSPPSAEPTGPAPFLTALFRFVSRLDQTALRAIGDYDVLHPSDPRPLLLLADLHRNGPRTPGTIPALIDRSRSATYRLLRALTAADLVATGAPDGGGPGSLVRIRPDGRRAVLAVATALGEDLLLLRPSIEDLARSLARTAT